MSTEQTKYIFRSRSETQSFISRSCSRRCAMAITTDVFTSRIPLLLSPKAPGTLARLCSISCSPPPAVSFFRINDRCLSICRKMMLTAASASASSTTGLYSAEQFELTAENVDMVLEAVRPYLIADGGNVDVVSVVDGVVSLKLQGACESCPSSTTTMTMGIEKVLKEKFGAALKDICQVYDEPINNITVEAINRHLDILRPAIKNYGGIVEVLSVEGEQCLVKYVGPESIGSGIKAAIKEKFPGIVNVVFTD